MGAADHLPVHLLVHHTRLAVAGTSIPQAVITGRPLSRRTRFAMEARKAGFQDEEANSDVKCGPLSDHSSLFDNHATEPTRLPTKHAETAAHACHPTIFPPPHNIHALRSSTQAWTHRSPFPCPATRPA